MEEAKVSFRDVWLDTPCRIHSWCQQKADPVKGLKMSSMWPTKVTCLRKFYNILDDAKKELGQAGSYCQGFSMVK
jgi:hypothetical protein